MATARIGTSGWSYDHWQGLLYPNPTPVGKRLPYYLSRYDTVELNASYYRWPTEKAFQDWYERTPEGFTLAVKASRGLSHFAKLHAPERWLDRMTAGLRHLKEKLGPLLVQLPRFFGPNPERLDSFLAHVPDWIRVAMEFRHPGWHVEEIFRILERHGAGYCVMSGANLPCVLRATAPLVYVRFHGPDAHSLYSGSYSDSDLRWWADRICEWQDQGRAVYGYFNNDPDGNALRDADRLKEFLAQRSHEHAG